MKLLYILISLALVGRVSVTKLDDYIQQVFNTNDDMKNAKDLLPDIIKNIVLNEFYAMEAIAYMLAVPDHIECALRHKTYQYEDWRDELIPKKKDQNKIPFKNLAPGEGSSQSRNSGINLDPEEESENPGSLTILHFEDKLRQQKIMQAEITHVVVNGPSQDEIPDVTIELYPTVPEEEPIPRRNVIPFWTMYAGKSRMNVPKIKLENLANILEERRIKTTQDQRIRAFRSFDLTALGRARREMALEAITTLIRRNDPIFSNLHWMCRLLGVFKMIKYARSTIETYTMNEGYCYVVVVARKVSEEYRFIDRELWQVDLEDHSTPIKSFLTELE